MTSFDLVAAAAVSSPHSVPPAGVQVCVEDEGAFADDPETASCPGCAEGLSLVGMVLSSGCCGHSSVSEQAAGFKQGDISNVPIARVFVWVVVKQLTDRGQVAPNLRPVYR